MSCVNARLYEDTFPPRTFPPLLDKSFCCVVATFWIHPGQRHYGYMEHWEISGVFLLEDI